MGSRSVRDVIQNQTVLTLKPGTSVRVAARAMARYKVGSVMVVEGKHLVGIFTERDALFRVLAASLDPEATTLAAVMTHDVTTIAADRLVVHALHLMNDNGFRHVPVVEDGVPIGMISIRDALGTELVAFEREVRLKQDLTEGIR
ncbi:CBS domain-containing protein [Limobrevibacterium gyesilva]|uniref:CBS domain-containing protein n=1 Tax=Limobrevibacterium gyesilva TaxID=2991712 RepID=A0AA41YW31_9PROT|nr:CBS domain-containing protein [Limobrevibacterium gyesilva]MCW3476442.1 CBS domain-containing protein [Limobrevibacterium gyesilva]